MLAKLCILSCQTARLSRDRLEEQEEFVHLCNICSKYIVFHVALLFNSTLEFNFSFQRRKSTREIYFSCQNCAALHVMWKMAFTLHLEKLKDDSTSLINLVLFFEILNFTSSDPKKSSCQAQKPFIDFNNSRTFSSFPIRKVNRPTSNFKSFVTILLCVWLTAKTATKCSKKEGLCIHKNINLKTEIKWTKNSRHFWAVLELDERGREGECFGHCSHYQKEKYFPFLFRKKLLLRVRKKEPQNFFSFFKKLGRFSKA